MDENESDLVKSYRAAWESAKANPDPRMRAMLLNSLAASVSDWGNDIWFVSRELLEELGD